MKERLFAPAEDHTFDYENYMELYEAVYFFNRINCCTDNKFLQLINKNEVDKSGLNERIYKSIIRILVVNNLLDYDGNRLLLTNENIEKHRYILDNVINKKNPYTNITQKEKEQMSL